jgi:hypothetical protein
MPALTFRESIMASTAELQSDPAGPAGQETVLVEQETVLVEHLVHGLVAIANGPDYCLCGGAWPCARREDRPQP